MRRIGFRERNGAAVCVNRAVFQLFTARGMEMSVEKDIPFLQKGRILLVEQMPVGQKESFAFCRKERVVGKNGEFKHHLIDFAIAISTHAKDFILDFVEHSKNLFRRVIVGEIVSRPVIEKVAQKDELVRIFVMEYV